MVVASEMACWGTSDQMSKLRSPDTACGMRIAGGGESRRSLMERYKNLSGQSGVAAYEIDRDSITVKFDDGWIYLYTMRSAGAANVAHMQRLAVAGRGLCTFVSQYVKKRYARKYR
jgi:hypothetical protein